MFLFANNEGPVVRDRSLKDEMTYYHVEKRGGFKPTNLEDIQLIMTGKLSQPSNIEVIKEKKIKR